MNQGMGEQIGGSIGKVIGVDVQEDGLAWSQCLRLKIYCDLKKLIARGKAINVEGRRMWVLF